MQVICFPRRPLTSDKQRHKDSFTLLLSHSSAEKKISSAIKKKYDINVYKWLFYVTFTL